MQTLPALWTTAMHLGVWPAVTSIHLGSMSLQSNSFSAAVVEETTLQTIVVGVSGKKQRRPLQTERKGRAAERMASPRACHRPNELKLSFPRTGGNHIVRGGRVVKVQATPSPTSTSSHTGRRTELQAATTGGQRKPSCPAVLVVESQPPRSKQTDSASSPPQGQSSLEGIADLLENLPTNACVELTRRRLSAASSLPTGEVRLRAVLKTVILFIAEYDCAA
jgi:hypothetical protein